MRSLIFIFIALCLLLIEFSAGRRRAEHALSASEERLRAANAALQAEVAKDRNSGRESEARLSALAGSTDEVVFEFDGNGKYLNIWTSNEAMLFRPRHELIGRTLAEVFDEGWARHHVERLRRVLASGTPEIYQWRIDLPSGRRWFLGRMNAMPSLDGARRTVCCLVRDITQQKRDEGSRRAQYGVARALADSDSLAAAAPRFARSARREHGVGLGCTLDRRSRAQPTLLRSTLACAELCHAGVGRTEPRNRIEDRGRRTGPCLRDRTTRLGGEGGGASRLPEEGGCSARRTAEWCCVPDLRSAAATVFGGRPPSGCRASLRPQHRHGGDHWSDGLAADKRGGPGSHRVLQPGPAAARRRSTRDAQRDRRADRPVPQAQAGRSRAPPE